MGSEMCIRDRRDYLAEIDEGGVEVIYDRMQKLLESTDSINQSDIDDITDGICSLMTNAAVRLDMCKSQACMREDKDEKNPNEPRRQEIKKTKYPWFDAECEKKRAEYRKAKGMHKSHANYYTKGERARAHKEYKKSSKQKKPNAHESLPRKDNIIAFFGSTCILENPEQ